MVIIIRGLGVVVGQDGFLSPTGTNVNGKIISTTVLGYFLKEAIRLWVGGNCCVFERSSGVFQYNYDRRGVKKLESGTSVLCTEATAKIYSSGQERECFFPATSILVGNDGKMCRA